MTKLYLIQAEDLPVYFDGIVQGGQFIPDGLFVAGAPFSIPAGELSFGPSDLVPDPGRPDVLHPNWDTEYWKLLAFSRNGWKMVLKSNQGRRLFAVDWHEPYTNSWLRRFLPDCLVTGAACESDITLSVLFDTELREMRFDWKLKADCTFSLLGVDVDLPSPVTLSAILHRETGATRLNRLALLLLDSQPITITSDFAWTRETLREVLQFHPDKASVVAGTGPAFQFDLTPPLTDTLVLADTYLDGTHPPTFLRRVAAQLAPLEIPSPESELPLPSDLAVDGLDISNWNPKFTLLGGFTFPFLYIEGNGSGGLDRFTPAIEVTAPDIDGLVPDDRTFGLSVPVEITIGSLSFSSKIPFEFDCEKMAVMVDHPSGIDITISKERLEQSFLGLNWAFIPNGDGTLFTLVTEEYNYQLTMAEGAELILEFTQMSADPIRFSVTNFAVSGKGITLTAEVTDDPARLNGINTLFRFSGSRLEIVDNVIQDLTLRGSGPLPPDLVGEAIVDVSLQFGRDRDGNFTLKSGGAKLQGSQLLACKATRFQFSVDAIGLQFVNDGGYHLYFTLTGSAQFVPAPADGKDHALAFLPGIKLDLVDCPLTSDISVLAKHIQLLIEFPKPKKFRFLGAYEMELRAIGFIPSFEPFDGDAAMQITGQVLFAQGKGDAKDAKPDYHSLYIGLPEKGSFLPRLYFKDLPLNLNLGTAIQLSGEVGFLDDPTEKGFWGEGTLEIQGLPPISATFAFMRVRRNEESPWLRAWFVYVNVSKLSLPLPMLKLYIREIGLGFGYRYTLVSIQAADQEQDLKDLLYKLRTLSRTQGELARRENWAVDLEDPGQDPRWTIVLRAMMAQNSASKSPLVYRASDEKELSNLYLLDIVAAFRSDLTFYMAARGWLNTNYNDYLESRDDIAQRPVVSGFILYSTRRKRFLAQVASNPGGYIGTHPALPPPLKKAIQNAQVSATLLMEPGLAHFEMGWPNMLRWKEDYGPLTAEYRGGFIFRVTPDELVLGVSFLAHAHLAFQGGVSLKIIGVRVRAEADVQYGGRIIGVVGLREAAFKVYAALGIEIRCKITIEVWIDLFFWSDSWALSLTLNFTAGLELGVIETDVGVRGRATLAIGVAGHDLHVGVSFGANERVVDHAYSTTQKYLTMGLEATEVEAVPGITAQPELPREQEAAEVRPETVSDGPGTMGVRAAQAKALDQELHIPNYSVFVIRTDGKVDASASAGDAEKGLYEGYFVLMPQGQNEEDVFKPEMGFLPPPPMKSDGTFDYQATSDDFRLAFPTALNELYHYDPKDGEWTQVVGTSCSWTADWQALVVQAAQKHDESGNGNPTENGGSLTLAEYLREAFITTDDKVRRPVGDPDPLGDGQVLADERVQNPSDAAFEAAVRGAVEQFRGSPFFKRDPELEYDRILTEAFKPDASIYARPPGNGSQDAPSDADASKKQQVYQESQQRAYQMRGLVIQKLIGDLQEYARDPERFRAQMAHSVPFQMGLVFGFNGEPPDWLTDYLANEDKLPKIFQRNSPDSRAPAGEPRHVRTFTIRDANFATNPPQFQKVRHYADAHTIAITWELTWAHALANVPPESRQADPEHHLLHYQVRRRPLESGEREVVYTVKSAQVLHRENSGNGDVLKRLKPRFQLVDHFGKATEQQAAALPAAGRTYLYTITPKDLAGNRGRPLTVVATRYPNDPPTVPVDGQLTVPYKVTAQDLKVRSAVESGALGLLKPDEIRVEWSEPRQQGSPVPVKEYRLIFRRDATLPIGSYGLDSDTQRSRTASLPTGSARPLPTDIKVRLEAIEREPNGRRRAVLQWKDLQTARVVPPGESPQWRPESWQVFFQTVSIHDVPSALAPVNLLLEIGDGEVEPTRLRPAGLEWLPKPTYLPMLPPEDQKARPGVAHVPMPPKDGGFDGTVDKISFQKHPADVRLLHFRWNQGPSAETDTNYPLDLIGGYDLLELDVDAHTKDTFEDKDLLAQALRPIAEVQMLPGDERPWAPNNTLKTNQWEAWYPSQVLRRQVADRAVKGAEKSTGSWYSWRDSLLVWPQWSGLTDGDGVRDAALHPALQAILDRLRTAGYTVDVQLAPPLQPGTLSDLMEVTSKNNDPYGWAVLQQLGLSVAVSLRYQQAGVSALDNLRAHQAGDPVLGADLVSVLKEAIDTAELADDLCRHLYVDLLFQPGRCIAPDDKAEITADALLATVQLSLRPAIHKVYQYGQITLSGTGSQEVAVKITPKAHPCLVINQADSSRTSAQLEPGTETILWILLPSSGQTNILLRSRSLPQTVTVTALDKEGTRRDQVVRLDEQIEPDSDTSFRSFNPDDPLTLYFPLPDTLAAEFSNPLEEGTGEYAYNTQWRRFKRYVEALNSSDPGVPRISVPTEALSTDRYAKEVFAKYLLWSQRFFDHSGGPTEAPQTAYLATAYPRTVSPVLASPDRSGRLRYDHLLADQWAHTYRYYFRPYGRYEKLWRSIAQSLKRQQALEVSPQDWLDKQGGLDVILERTRPVAMPVVLSSSRLDVPGEPGSPALPGKWWEVIVARHPEQALIERNQTLARQLAFRQVAFTLLRRFGYAEYLDKLKYLPGYTMPTKPVESLEQAIPGAYPDEPDHLALTKAMPAEDRIAMLDLPARIGAFQQGAIALQWEALPFYYEHRLLLIAQTDSTVSAVNEITQRAFEYVTPAPSAMAVGAEGGIEIHIQLKRFWDSLPDAARKQWAGEDPSDGQPKFSALPDPDVIYQLIEIYSGNVEAQADIYFDMQQGKYIHRQIGKRFKVVGEIGEPTKDGDDFYELPVTVEAIAETEPLGREPISLEAIEKLEPAGMLVSIRDVDECTLVWFGSISEDQKPIPMSLSGDVGFQQALKRLAEAAAKPTMISIPPGPIPSGTDSPVLEEQLSILSDDTKRALIWSGGMDDPQRNKLLALPGDDFFRGGIEALISQVQHKVTYETAPRGLDQVPSRFLFEPDGTKLKSPKADFTQEVDNGAKVYTQFLWTGIMTDDDEAALRRWAQIPEFRTAADQLVDTLDGRVLSETMVPPRPAQADVPDAIKQQLTIRGMPTPSISWNGRWTGTDQIRALGDLKSMAPSGDTDFRTAIDRIVNDLQKQKDKPEVFEYTQDLTPPRPEQSELSQDPISGLQSQLTIGEETLTWRKRLRTPGQLERLEELQKVGDQSFREAVENIIKELKTFTTSVPLDIPVRPTTGSLQSDETLPQAVRKNLLIGTAALEYEGVMPASEAQSCIEVLSQPADKKALEQLYRQTVRHGLQDNGLKIATRRGSARVSEMRIIPIQDLTVDGSSVEKGPSTPVSGGQNQQPI